MSDGVTEAVDTCVGAVCGVLTLNIFLQSVNLIIAIVAGLCAIIWFGVRIYDRFYKKDKEE